MSAVWLKLITILCLSHTATSAPGGSGVVWKKLGEDVTIRCTSSHTDEDNLTLKKGLMEDTELIFIERRSKDVSISSNFQKRLEHNQKFPTVEILIKNLTSEDTGIYWCVFKRFDMKSEEIKTTKGSGSVLLVVKDERPASHQANTAKQECETRHNTMILVCVVISATVLLCFITGTLIWLIKTKSTGTTVNPRQVPTNDVYEDMRGTLRR